MRNPIRAVFTADCAIAGGLKFLSAEFKIDKLPRNNGSYSLEANGPAGRVGCIFDLGAGGGGTSERTDARRIECWRKCHFVMYDVLKLLHVLGVVVLVGNVTITAFWKVFSDLTGRVEVIAHATRGVIVADWIFTLLGIALVMLGGFGAAAVGGLPAFGTGWLVAGEVLFVLSGLIWIGILVPLQIKQDRAVRGLRSGDAIPEAYWRHGRLWLIWGVIATFPLIAAVYVMIAKIPV